MNEGVAKDEHKTLEVFDMHDTIVENGIFKALDQTGSVLDTGKYIVVWKKHKGDWKLHKDIFNTSLPAKKDVNAEITSCNNIFMEHFARNDAAAIASLYTEDGQLLPTHSDAIKGHTGIRSFWQAVFNMGITRVKLETADLEDHCDSAIESGSYTMYLKDGSEADTGKYVVFWQKQQGKWKLHRDIFNTSKPAQ